MSNQVKAGSSPLTRDQEGVLSSVRAIAMHQAPYYAAMLYSMRYFSIPAGTMGVDAGGRCSINFDFVKVIGLDAAAEVLLHECGHIFGRHHMLAKWANLPRDEWSMMNAAGDMAINDDLRDLGCVFIPENGLMPEQIKQPDYQDPLFYLAVLRELREQQKQQSPIPQSPHDDGGASDEDEGGQIDGPSDQGGDRGSRGDTPSDQAKGPSDQHGGTGSGDGSQDRQNGGVGSQEQGQGDTQGSQGQDGQDDAQDGQDGAQGGQDGAQGSQDGQDGAQGSQGAAQGGGWSDQDKSKADSYTGCGSIAGGEPAPWEDGDAIDADGNADPGWSDAEIERVIAETATSVLDHNKRRGNVPGGLVAIAENVFTTTTTPWQRLISANISAPVRAARGMPQPDYTKRDRRRSYRVGDATVIMPGKRVVGPRIAVVRDTSGSMTDADLQAVTNEVMTIARRLGVRGDSMSITDVDAVVQDARKFTGIRSLTSVSGRGGTDMSKGIEVLSEQRPKPSVIVVLTDGATPWPVNSLGVPVVACIIPNTSPHVPNPVGSAQGYAKEVPSWIKTVIAHNAPPREGAAA